MYVYVYVEDPANMVFIEVGNIPLILIRYSFVPSVANYEILQLFIFVLLKISAFYLHFLLLCFDIVLLITIFWVDYLSLPFILACHLRSNLSSHNCFVNFIL